MTVDCSRWLRRCPSLGLLVALVLAGLGGVASQARASQSVALSWKASPGTNVVAYKVYFGTQSGQFANAITFGNVTNVIIPGFLEGTTNYFAVSAVDAKGNESKLSNLASYIVPLTSTPLAAESGPTAHRSGKASASGGLPTLGPVAPLPAPVVLQSQIIPDDHGQPYVMAVNTFSAVSGAWELEVSTDLQHWIYYTSGTGSGAGDGHDVEVYIPVDGSAAPSFFRVVQ